MHTQKVPKMPNSTNIMLKKCQHIFSFFLFTPRKCPKVPKCAKTCNNKEVSISKTTSKSSTCNRFGQTDYNVTLVHASYNCTDTKRTCKMKQNQPHNQSKPNRLYKVLYRRRKKCSFYPNYFLPIIQTTI